MRREPGAHQRAEGHHKKRSQPERGRGQRRAHRRYQAVTVARFRHQPSRPAPPRRIPSVPSCQKTPPCRSTAAWKTDKIRELASRRRIPPAEYRQRTAIRPTIPIRITSQEDPVPAGSTYTSQPLFTVVGPIVGQACPAMEMSASAAMPTASPARCAGWTGTRWSTAASTRPPCTTTGGDHRLRHPEFAAAGARTAKTPARDRDGRDGARRVPKRSASQPDTGVSIAIDSEYAARSPGRIASSRSAWAILRWRTC